MKAIGKSVRVTKLKFRKHTEKLEILKLIGEGINLVKQFWIAIWLYLVTMNI